MLNVVDIAPDSIFLVDVAYRSDDAFQESDKVKRRDEAFVDVLPVDAGYHDSGVVILFWLDWAKVHIDNWTLGVAPKLHKSATCFDLFLAPAEVDIDKNKEWEITPENTHHPVAIDRSSP